MILSQFSNCLDLADLCLEGSLCFEIEEIFRYFSLFFVVIIEEDAVVDQQWSCSCQWTFVSSFSCIRT